MDHVKFVGNSFTPQETRNFLRSSNAYMYNMLTKYKPSDEWQTPKIKAKILFTKLLKNRRPILLSLIELIFVNYLALTKINISVNALIAD